MEILGHSEKTLTKLASKLLPDLRRSVIGVCTYGYVEENQGSLRGRVDSNHACIAGMMYYERNSAKHKPVLVVYDLSTRCGKTSITEERLAWAKWVSEESPWRHCFVMLDKFNPTINGVLVSRADISSNYLATANNILRIGIENSDKLDSWYTMVKAGVNASLALSLCVREVFLEDGQLVLGRADTHWSHSILNKTNSKGMLDLLAGKTLPNEGYSDTPYHTRLTYQGAYDYLYTLGGGDSTDLVSKFCKTKSKTVSKGEDLMGRSLGSTTGIFVSPEQLNEFWRDYVSAD